MAAMNNLSGMHQAKAWMDAVLAEAVTEPVLKRVKQVSLRQPPFSFVYDGRPSREILAGWSLEKHSQALPDGGRQHRLTYRDPKTSLECVIEYTQFADFPAIEWVVNFRNAGSADTPILEQVQALDSLWHVTGKPYLHRSLGSHCREDDFLYKTEPMFAGPSWKYDMEGGGGFSSDYFLPYFNMQMGEEGVIVGIGWTGQWAACVHHFEADTVLMRAGMELTHLKLHPGESIRTPRMLLLFWRGRPGKGLYGPSAEGTANDGNNLLRRFILKHHRPSVNGKPVEGGPLTAGAWGGMKTELHMRNLRLIGEHHLPYEYYWIDAGWYGPADSYSPDENKGDWYRHVGNWNVNPKVHPGGLRPISDAAGELGMKFLLWFEPERAVWGTPLTQEHPEWFLGKREAGASLLFDLGNEAARRWMTDYISSLIQQHGVQCYRQDFNFYCLKYWRDNDAPHRQGITEIGHVQGLYAFWDELRRRHPYLLIDSCSSGGRRLDLEATTRSIPLTRSDHQCSPNNDPIGGQVQIMGLSRWLPLHGTGQSADAYLIRSNYGTSMGMGFAGYEYSPIGEDFPWEWLKKMAEQFLRARPLLLGDFYPLAGSTNDPSAWAAWQNHREDLDQGLVIALRRDESPFQTARFRLDGLDEQAAYELEDADSGVKTRRTGKELAEGLEITIDQPHQSQMIFYRRV